MNDRTPDACDLLIEAGYVVPVVPHGVVLEQHAVAVTGGRIVAILPVAEARTFMVPLVVATSLVKLTMTFQRASQMKTHA